MKWSFACFFLLVSLVGFSQPEWKCVYRDSAILVPPDSLRHNLAADLRQRNVTEEALEDFKLKLIGTPVSTTRTRYVTANSDSTVIDIEASEEGNLRLDNFANQDLLLKNKELYIMTGSGNYDSMVTTPLKVFKPSGRQPSFFNYNCREYISADSVCIIWVAEELPSFVNPGIRTGDIKGAVLFFELKSTGGVVIRCGISRIVQKGKK